MPGASTTVRIVLLALCVCTLTPAQAQRAHAASVMLGASPASLSFVVSPGGRATASLRLSNPADVPITPLVYEALDPGAARHQALLTYPARVPLPQQPARLDPLLARRAALDTAELFTVYLADQADLRAAYAIEDWQARGAYVFQTLQEHARRTQRDLRAELDIRGVWYQPLWIVNALMVRGTQADAVELSGRADVALVRGQHTTELPHGATSDVAQAPASQCNPENPTDPICWNIHAIGADRVWRDFGVTGAGVVVAGNDSGVAFEHPALVTRYRGYRAPGLFDHSYNWYDPQFVAAAPLDGSGHGTHTLGTMVAGGNGSAEQPAVGVAPGARWIAAQGCGSQFCTESDLILAAQWLLAPTDLADRNPRPDLRPMIVNNSWAGPGGDEWYAGYTAAWRAAGMFAVFAAGNSSVSQRQACGSVASPADYGDVLSVGAVDHQDTITSFSLFGPARSGRIKPDLVAPGAYASGQLGIVGAFHGPGASYKALQGTSMASPHAAGVVALLWSANPALIGDYDATLDILRATAHGRADVRCGDGLAVPNNIYGSGSIDAYAAVERARPDVPWLELASAPTLLPGGVADMTVSVDAYSLPGPGTYSARVQIYAGDFLQTPTSVPVLLTVLDDTFAATVSGAVRDGVTGQPIAARVQIAGGEAVPVGEQGFVLRMRPGVYKLTVAANGYHTRILDLVVDQAGSRIEIALDRDQPALEVPTSQFEAELGVGQTSDAVVIVRNTGSVPLHVRATIPPDAFSVWRSDEPLGPDYAWIDLPANAQTLALQSGELRSEIPLGFPFPFYGRIMTETVVAANGLLSFVEPFGSPAAASRCLPDSDLVFYTIAPFRAQLDPAAGGTVRYGTVGDKFVVSFERVGARDAPPGATYSFQTLLYADGRVVFQYKDIGPLPEHIAVGLQRTPSQVQQLGCGGTTPIHSGLAIELRPQLPASMWLASTMATLSVAPGSTVALPVQLRWTRPGRWPLRGTLRLFSDDPWRPTVDVPVMLRTQLAVAEQWFPVSRAPASALSNDAIIPP